MTFGIKNEDQIDITPHLWAIQEGLAALLDDLDKYDIEEAEKIEAAHRALKPKSSTLPEYDKDLKCPVCNGEAVAMRLMEPPETSVYWCIDGHVSANIQKDFKLVYTFGEEK